MYRRMYHVHLVTFSKLWDHHKYANYQSVRLIFQTECTAEKLDNWLNIHDYMEDSELYVSTPLSRTAFIM